ncbi:zinc-dependent metalloprotease [Pinibacter soli]|uniref:Zinc-dependent metalloprotease n=1 Tax=Pinibacter soli TaxID=3044211 RepID=A0ABT6RIN7_9BACT|nr:zinc-dependent metalloprotease [Pinibacter soli]MDI3322430.1 zinc-dependent metalloprotease [Pinibacter soli]
MKMTRFRTVLLSTIACSALTGAAIAQENPGKKQPTQAPATVPQMPQGMPPRPPKEGPKPYKEVITSKAITDAGLFKVHKVEDKFYFEIPDSLLGRDILIVNRITKAASGARSGFLGYAGDQIGDNVIQFSKGPNNKIFIKSISFQEVSKDTSANGMYRSVLNSNLQPIVAAFDVKAYAYKDSTSKSPNASVIDFTDYISGDNDILFFESAAKNTFKLGMYQGDKSYIQNVRSFPMNVEIRTVKTYLKSGPQFPGVPPSSTPATYELNSSMVLLPAVPMQSRYFDSRVGYFATGYVDFDADPQGVKNVSMITRWRLEPKPEDVEKYKRGELVEPKKPIVFYIDPATPKKWVPYLIQGVNDWQAAFEKAGWKNAIIAKEAPTNDPQWSLEDASHSAIVYKPSDIPNASGPHVHDPRSGEIIETHVNWYHNVMSLVRNWYMIQTAAVDPKARKMRFDDELMGQLIRFVSSHEVGHTLGLRHNFGSSSTVPVEKLRDKKWVEANGHTPSIMDYARFNYVAQPEDNITEKGLFPRIGDYDMWAIQWGYRWFPEAKTSEAEDPILNKWIIDSLNANKRLWFGTESDPLDPRCQNEDLGDDAMKAGAYGIKNLQRILPNLEEWTKEPNDGYNNLATMYREVTSQFGRYMGHAAKNIGGVMTTPKTIEQSGAVYEFVSKAKQKEAMAFLQAQLFKTPTWLINKKYSAVTGSDPVSTIGLLQESSLNRLLNAGILNSLVKAEAQLGTEAYTVTDMLSDLKKGIWTEVAAHQKIDIYRRNLQKVYVDRLIALFVPQDNPSPTMMSAPMKSSDVTSLAKAHARTLAAEIRAAVATAPDAVTKAHLQDIADKLTTALDPKK